MGTILHLNPAARSQVPATGGDTAENCEIVIFPGVRIEREEIAARIEASASDGRDEDRDDDRKRL